MLLELCFEVKVIGVILTHTICRIKKKSSNSLYICIAVVGQTVSVVLEIALLNKYNFGLFSDPGECEGADFRARLAERLVRRGRIAQTISGDWRLV